MGYIISMHSGVHKRTAVTVPCSVFCTSSYCVSLAMCPLLSVEMNIHSSWWAQYMETAPPPILKQRAPCTYFFVCVHSESNMLPCVCLPVSAGFTFCVQSERCLRFVGCSLACARVHCPSTVLCVLRLPTALRSCWLFRIVWKSVKNGTDRNQIIKVPTTNSTGNHLWSCLLLRVRHPCLFITSDLDVQSRRTGWSPYVILLLDV